MKPWNYWSELFRIRICSLRLSCRALILIFLCWRLEKQLRPLREENRMLREKLLKEREAKEKRRKKYAKTNSID